MLKLGKIGERFVGTSNSGAVKIDMVDLLENRGFWDIAKSKGVPTIGHFVVKPHPDYKYTTYEDVGNDQHVIQWKKIK